MENHTLCYDWASIILLTCLHGWSIFICCYMYSFQVKPCYFRGCFPFVKISVCNLGQLQIVTTCYSFDVFIKHTLSAEDYISSFSWPHLSAGSQCPIYHKQLSWTETSLDYVIIEICMYPVINILSLMSKYLKLIM